MKTISRLIAAGNLLAVLAMAQASSYTVTDLGVEGPGGQPFSVSKNGLVSATSAVTGGAYHAVVWYRGLQTDIGAAGFGGPNSAAFGVNARSQTIGLAETTELDPYGEDFCGYGTHLICLPFVWQSGLTSPLPTLGGMNGTAYMINSSGQVAGVAETAAWDPACPSPQKFQAKPVLWTNGTAQELATAPGDLDGFARAVNDNGQVVGASGACAGFNELSGYDLQPLHALLWSNGTMTDLGNLGGTGHGMGIFAEGLNNQEQVVGVSDVRGDMAFHAFLWAKATGMQDLGTLSGDFASLGIAINDAGTVVGVSVDPQFNPRAFIWQNGQMTDLNTLIPADSPLYLGSGCSINSSGQIIGFAFDSAGNIHGYLATPSAGPTANVEASTTSRPRPRRLEPGQDGQRSGFGRLWVR